MVLNKENKLTFWIISISIIVPVVVAILYFIPKPNVNNQAWIAYLPHVNALINSITTLTLISGYFMIRHGNQKYHKWFMTLSLSLGVLFLLSYIIYHTYSESAIFGDINKNGILDPDEIYQIGSLRSFYLVILLMHILFAIVVVPFVLLAFYYALSSRFDNHKKIVKFTWPIWLFVSISGVVVYLMISPYY